MNIEDYSNFLLQSAKENFEKNKKYFDFDRSLFSEFRPSIYQINNCLILKLYIPALTATNYMIERLLKVSLIYNEVKSKTAEIQNLNALYKLPNKKYTNLNFEKSIEKCRSLGLIDDFEREFLDKKIRPLIRNSYSHGDPTKIRKTLPKKTKGYVASFENPGNLEEIEFENDSIPTFQSQIFDEFAEENSQIYFDFAYNLIFKIEDRINYFNKNKE